jgi:hypothetical protein
VKLPFFKELENAKTVLIAGAGGGFDVFCGLPLYFWLKQAGKSVHLANLSFTNFDFSNAKRPIPSLVRVGPDTGGSAMYFPEVHLAKWLSERFGETSVFAIDRGGVKPVEAAYEWMVQTLHPDALILIDGGTDSLMRGDEIGLGTPQEDMASLYAANAVEGVQQKYLVCLGFGIDAFHGVCHAHFLENAAALIANEGHVGTWSLMYEMEEFRLYREACDFVMARMPRHPSIVNSSIISAVMGGFGDQHATKRTEGSELFINPLMALYWAFRVEHVARRNLMLDLIGGTNTYQELSMAIEAFHATVPKMRAWKDIPC